MVCFYNPNPLGFLFRTRDNAAANIIDIQNPSELTGKKVMGYIAPESRDDVFRDFYEVGLGHDGYFTQYWIISENHGEKWVESVGKVIYYENSPSILISLRDITSKKQGDEEHRLSREKYENHARR